MSLSHAPAFALQPDPRFLRFLPAAAANTTRRVALVGTLPPRRCGIATFTADVQASLNAAKDWQCDVVSIVDEDHPFNSQTSLLGIRHHEPSDYKHAAVRLNHMGVDVVSIQHEFGIFGGADGSFILDFMSALNAPCVVTLHTVIENPTLGQRLVLASILRLSAHVIVMAKKGLELLVSVYGANRDRVSVCPHGAPDRPRAKPAGIKSQLGLAGKHVLLTFGLLSPGKGLETMIGAMPAIIEDNPSATYVILGATHPHLVKREGEKYRQTLIAQAARLGVQAHVMFVDSFVDNDLLLDYLSAADIYVTPYMNVAQVTSGTLAYAIALGKPVVSTPYWHAAEVVDDSTGALVGFGDVRGFSDAISSLLNNPGKLEDASLRAYERGRPTIWARSGEHYVKAFDAAIAVRVAVPVHLPKYRMNTTPRLDAVERATDSCGIHQHSSYGITNRAHGYCIDDNVRGLILVQRLRRLGESSPNLDALERTFAAFIQHAWNRDTGRFRNFMGYDRSWLEAVGSEDSNGRAYWALGETARYAADPEIRIWAKEMAKQVGDGMSKLTSLRARCFAILGAEAFLACDDDDEVALEILTTSAENLLAKLEEFGQPSWMWFEASLSYDNARIPQALIKAGYASQRPDWLAGGLNALAWLATVQTAPNGYFRAVGSQTLGNPYAPPTQYDQQPIEACATVDAALSAFEATGNTKWLAMAKSAHAWFFGENDLGLSLCDGAGGCFDGLTPTGLNRNQGGESILALQMANVAMAGIVSGDMSQSRRIDSHRL